jgi:1,2-diacylglycerol 3-alpha-glucosyltransferase
MEKRKIGLVTTWFERGAAYVSKQYVDALKSDFDVFIYVRGGEKYAIDDPNWNADNLYWGKRFKYLAGSYINLEDFRNWLILNKIEIAFFNEQHNWSPIIACSKLGILTGAYIDYYKKDTVKLFNSYDFVICNTKRHFSVFENHEQSFYVPWGTDVNLFSPKPKPKKFQDRIVFFHSAGMNPKRKGTDLVIRAANQIKDSQFSFVNSYPNRFERLFPRNNKHSRKAYIE